MHKDQMISLRLPRELLERASAVVPYLEAEVLKSARVSRSTAIRHALERGLSELEEDAAMKSQLRESVFNELLLGEPPNVVALKYEDQGYRLSDVMKIAAEVAARASKPKAKKRSRRKSR